MRLFWGSGFAIVLVLGAWLGSCSKDAVQGSEKAGFLDNSVTAAETTSSAPAVTAKPAPPPAAAPQPVQAALIPPPAPMRATRVEEQEIAAALLHRPWSEVSVRLSQSELSAARRAMFSAVSAAIAGDREHAMKSASSIEKSDELDAREHALVASAVAGTNVGALPASSGSESIAAISMGLALRARDAALALSAGRFAEAAKGYSDVLLADATATWPSDRTALQRWSDGIALAQAGHRWNVKGNWPSINTTVKPGDSLTLVRQRVLKEHPELLICTGLIERANQLKNEKSLHPNDVLRIPTERAHMLVDISTRWVMYMMGEEVVAAWEGGVGKPGNDTVPGQYKIGSKMEKPSWFRSGAKPVPFGDPENPLGTRWLSWQANGVESHLGFHGTTDPSTVGGAVSSGCVRLRNQDVEVLFEILPEKADVLVQP
ncbi:MAG TPA: L,D-transpeptidase [Planctomycetota bacterium]|nr:L,D-transpeptidase [Planctomycetota bacterium]